MAYDATTSDGWEADVVFSGVSALASQEFLPVSEDGMVGPLEVEVRSTRSRLVRDDSLVIQFRLSALADPQHPEFIRVYLVATDGVFAAVSAEYYNERLAEVTPQPLTFAGGFIDPAPLRELPAEVRESAAAFESSALLAEAGTRAVSRSVMSYLVFWDHRDMGVSALGSRIPWCDTTDGTCVLGDTECCFRAFPRVEVQLRKGAYWGPVVDTTTTSGSGFFWLARVVDTASGGAAFPTMYPGGYQCSQGHKASESASLREAIPSLIEYLTRWDPDDTESTSLPGCNYDNAANSKRNDCSSFTNNARALWELIDTDDDNTDDSCDDLADLTLADVMDGMVHWQTNESCYLKEDGNPCENWTLIGDDCDTGPEACGVGEVCCGELCRYGDPHGGNIHDWIDHIAAVTSGTEADYEETIVSCPCVGPGIDTDSTVYDGGFVHD